MLCFKNIVLWLAGIVAIVAFIIVAALGGMGLVVKTPEEAARKAQKKAEKYNK